ncbi:hypothetical protein HZP54_16925 [Elizabethkingia anophelis]|nr:hypothetical protein [Elizabethkingia anophelis]
MNEIITAIINKLNEVPELIHKDENWGQLQLYGIECPVSWPCALVDIASGQFSNNGKDIRLTPTNRQEGVISIEITVANIKLSNTSFNAPIGQKKNAFKIWELVEKVHQIIQGFKPVDNAGGMTRASFQSITRDDGIQEKKIIYTIGLHNC